MAGFACQPVFLFAQNIQDMNREAEKYFDKKEFNKAIAIWLNILDANPDNEMVQKKIEMIFDIKQRKDLALQKSRLSYKIAKKRFKREELEKGVSSGKSAMNNFIIAYRIDPYDPELRGMLESMKLLEKDVKAAQEKLRVSRELREKAAKLKALALEKMKAEDYNGALVHWKEILSYFPADVEAIEGRRTCTIAIENRLKYERIRNFMATGRGLFEQKKYRESRLEFRQVMNIDPRNREARDYIEIIDEKLEEKRLYTQRARQAEDFYRSGIQNIAQKKFDQAEEDFEAVLALIENYRDAKQRLAGLDGLRKEYARQQRLKRIETINREFQNGLVALAQARYRDAIAAFEVTLNLDPENARAREYIEQAKNAQKKEEDERVDENSPYYNIVNSLIVSGKALFEKGQFKESRVKWDRILKLFPQNRIATEYKLRCDFKSNPEGYLLFSKSIVQRGREDMKKGNHDDALKKFELIKSISDDYPGINKLIAMARKGKRESTVRLAPADRREVERRYRRALVLYGRGGAANIKLALDELKWVTRRDPANTRALITLNKIEVQLRGGGVIAQPVRTKLTDAQRKKAMKHYYNGINYYSNNNFKKAIQEWRLVLAIDPNNVKAKNNIRKTLIFLGR